MPDISEQLIQDIRGKFEATAFKTEVVEPVNDEVIRLTRENTLEGKGLGDNTFSDYAPSTQKRKGRSSPVTFRETQATMDSLYGEAHQEEGVITFSHNAEIMGMHQDGEGRNPKREVFPEDEQETPTIQTLTDFAGETLRRYLQDGS